MRFISAYLRDRTCCTRSNGTQTHPGGRAGRSCNTRPSCRCGRIPGIRIMFKRRVQRHCACSHAEADFEGDELSGPPLLIEDFETEAAQPSRQVIRLCSWLYSLHVLLQDFCTPATYPDDVHKSNCSRVTRRKAKEKKSRLRADIALQGPAYLGRRTSRAAAFDTGGSSSASQSAR